MKILHTTRIHLHSNPVVTRVVWHVSSEMLLDLCAHVLDVDISDILHDELVQLLGVLVVLINAEPAVTVRVVWHRFVAYLP